VAILEIKIQDQLLDLYDTEKIVQSFSLINIEDITKRESEYSNTFKVPKTNKNLQNLGYADFLNSDSLIPYSRLNCEILIDGFIFKKGFISIENIDEDISLRFFTGNAGFYEIIKNKSINQIDTDNTPSLKTIWNLSNVVSRRTANEGLIFPMIDYNGMPSASTTVDVRLLLPAFYRKTLIQSIVEDAGYTLVNNMTESIDAYNNDILPTSRNNLKNDAATITKNSYKGGDYDLNGMRAAESIRILDLQSPFFFFTYRNNQGNTGNTLQNFKFAEYIEGNQSRYILNGPNYYFLCDADGEYNVNLDLNVNYTNGLTWTNVSNVVPAFDVVNRIEWFVVINDTNFNLIHKTEYPYINTSSYGGSTISITFTDIINKTKKVVAQRGDKITLQAFVISSFYNDTTQGGSLLSNFTATTSIGDTFEVKLAEGLAFNGAVSPENCLSDIRQADLFKDTCIRYGLIPIVDEDNKKVTLFEFSEIKSNIQNAVDWSNKLDETKDYNLEFKIDSYAQRNNIKHKEDKFLLSPPSGSDGAITISNDNLPVEKDLYISPFAASETVERLNGKKVIYIDLHDGVSLINTSSFKNGVTARTCYIENDDFTVTYTDGTSSTIVSSSIPLTWFIDADKNYNAGFSTNLLDYSVDLINILQRLKIVKCEIRLNILDIINLNYFYPIYIDEFNSYFFLSKISQFDYTSNDSTSVELIKLN
jgi:hypothetical protein